MKSYVFPGIIEDSILSIGSWQIPYMRTQEFSKMNLESEKILLDLIGCKNGRTIIYTGSGTGAMDAVVANYVTTKNKAFIINGGTFGERWSLLCDYYKCDCYNYIIPFAKDINYDDLEKQIAVEKPDVLLCQHHETSSGQLFDLKKISDICHKYYISLVVDVISSFLVEELDMDKLGIDICITSTQKGLNIPPGLSIVFFSSRLNDYGYNHESYYFDFNSNFDNLKRGQTPFSPATTLYLQLHMRLKQLEASGVDANIKRVQNSALYFRELCEMYSWNIPAETPSYAITGFYVNNKSSRIFRSLIEEFDTFIMPGAQEGFYRVSHMGLQSREDLLELARHIHEIEVR